MRGVARRPAAVDGHRFAHLGEAHVVEQNHRRAGIERLFEFVECFDFDFDELAFPLRRGGHLFGSRHRRANAAGGEDMVFLDQDRVVKPDSMVAAAPALDGVFLRQTQAGQRLARIDYLRMGSGDDRGVLRRFGGDTGK